MAEDVFPSAAATLKPMPPVISPLQAAQQQMALQQSKEESQLRQQAIQENSLQLQSKAQDQKDANTVRGLAQIYNGDPDKIHDALSKINPTLAEKFWTPITTQRKTDADTIKLHLDNAAAQNSMVTQALESVTDQPSLEAARKTLSPDIAAKLPATYDPAAIQSLKDQGTSLAEHNTAMKNALDAANKAREFTDAKAKDLPAINQKHLETLANLVSTTTSQNDLDQALKLGKVLGVPQDVIDQIPQQWSADLPAKIQQMAGQKPDVEAAGPGVWIVDKRTGKPIFQAPEKPPKPDEFDQGLAAYQKAHPAATVNDYQAWKAGLAPAASAAQVAATTAKNPALDGVDAKLIAPATAAAEKHQAAFTDAIQAANDMKSFIDLAKGGNKIAYSYAPVEGVLTLNSGRGIKRINMNEIAAYGGAGSALDRIVGFLGKQSSGASIPDDILSDMSSLHQETLKNAKTAFQQKLTGVNKIYGTKFSADDLSGTPATTPTASPDSAPATHRYNPATGKIEAIQ